ncbi:MAG: ChbG/HpnK family deacetylase, partial [Chloroflexota bacterium]
MTKQLIVNADDYGRTPSVSGGIRHAHLRGVVTTTTAMMNMPSVENDIRLALEECPNLCLGVHLVLTAGRPVLPPERVPSLAASDGGF